VNVPGENGNAGSDPVQAQARALITALVRQRAAAGLSRAEVANRTGIPRTAISRMESGLHDVLLSEILRYAGAVGLAIGLTGSAPGNARPAAGRRQWRVPVTGEPDPVLSRTQRRVLQAAIDAISREGFPPSMREIGEAVGLSTSSVEYQLDELERKGYVRRALGRSRALTVLNPVPPLPGDAISGD
jgi:SOS-response transcriptional repressor LexA